MSQLLPSWKRETPGLRQGGVWGIQDTRGGSPFQLKSQPSGISPLVKEGRDVREDQGPWSLVNCTVCPPSGDNNSQSVTINHRGDRTSRDWRDLQRQKNILKELKRGRERETGERGRGKHLHGQSLERVCSLLEHSAGLYGWGIKGSFTLESWQTLVCAGSK